MTTDRVDYLPVVVAEEARAQLSGALAPSWRHAAATSPGNDKSPTDHREAFAGEELCEPDAEPQYITTGITARPRIGSPSGAAAF
jgi:hypothetical protein